MKHSKILISIMMVLGMSIMLIIASCGDTGTSSTSLTSLEYSTSTLNTVVGGDITGITPTIVPEGATATYTVDPALPADLTLDPSSGAITGTPQVASVSTQYTVTATGTGDYTGEVNAKITITVAITLSSLTYSPPTLEAMEGETISEITPTIVPEGATATYKVDPALPADLTLDPSSGAITGTPQATSLSTQYTVTATGSGDYTGTMTAEITITVLALNIKATEMAKMHPNEDRRYHYVAFTIESRERDGITNLGRYKFGLKAGGEPPTVKELKDGAGIYRIVNATVKPNVLAYTLNSRIKTFIAGAQIQGKRVYHNVDGIDVDSNLLRPGTTYRLYGIKADGNAVASIADFSTDAFNGEIYTRYGKINDEKLYEGVPEYPYDMKDTVFIFPDMHTGYLNDISTISLSRHYTIAIGNQLQFLSGGSFTISADKFDSRSALVPSLGGSRTTGEAIVTVDGKTLGIGLLATPIPKLVLENAYYYAYAYQAGGAVPHSHKYSAILDK